MSETTLGPYELTARLGSGGMAEVWKATATGPGGFARTVVVKRILPHLADDERFAAMFLSEARLSGRLHHHNIVDVFACGEIDGRYYLAMEYVNGHDVHRILRAHSGEGPPPPGLAAYVMREVCRALAYAHTLTDDDGNALDLVHRDVSPSNVMVGYDGSVKLLDFGIARAFGELKDLSTRVSSLEGKRAYLAPEALAGRAIDARADQYSAGVVLHELCTGVPLFGRHDPTMKRPPVPTPSTINPAVPPELDRICLRALTDDRELRYPSCEEMAVELSHVAHQLAWGPEQVGALLQRLLPEQRKLPPPALSTASMSLPVGMGPASTVAGRLEPPTLFYTPSPVRPRRVWIGASASAVLLAGMLAWLVARCDAPTTPIDVPMATTPTTTPATPIVPLGPLPPVVPAPRVTPLAPPPSPSLPSPSPRPPAPHLHSTSKPKHAPPPPSSPPPPRNDLLKGDVLDPFHKK
jgi:serine/threonine protein kinase